MGARQLLDAAANNARALFVAYDGNGCCLRQQHILGTYGLSYGERALLRAVV